VEQGDFSWRGRAGTGTQVPPGTRILRSEIEGGNQIRRIELAPDKDLGGSAFDELRLRPAGPGRSGRIAEATATAGLEASSVATATPVGTALLEGCNWQQDCAVTIAEAQAIAIEWQQGWQRTGVRLASAGAAAHNAITVSMRIALFLPMSIIYARCLRFRMP
jgi:hypothetical protein